MATNSPSPLLSTKTKAEYQTELKRILTILNTHHVTFLPLTPSQQSLVQHQLQDKNIPPLQVSASQRLTNRVLDIKRARSDNVPHTKYQALYLDTEGRLTGKIVSLSSLLDKQPPNGLTMDLFDPECLPSKRQYVYSRMTLKGKSAFQQHNFSTQAYRALLRLPDKIGETWIDTGILSNAVRHAVQNIKSEQELTCLDCIRAEYAYRLLPGWFQFRLFQCANQLPPVYEKLLQNTAFAPQDNWSEQEKITDTISARPDNEVYKLLTRIDRPKLERDYNSSTAVTGFDRIRIFLSVKSKTSFPDRWAFIQTHQKDIAAIAAARIDQSKTFQKCGIPIEFLRLTSMILTNQDQLELIFELKTIKH